MLGCFLKENERTVHVLNVLYNLAMVTRAGILPYVSRESLTSYIRFPYKLDTSIVIVCVTIHITVFPTGGCAG